MIIGITLGLTANTGGGGGVYYLIDDDGNHITTDDDGNRPFVRRSEIVGAP